MAKLLHGHLKIIFLVTLKMLFIFYFVKLATIQLGPTQDFEQRIAKHKSDVKHPHNRTCRRCLEHLRDCNQAEPYFEVFSFYYEKNAALRESKEKQNILRWKPPLNLNKT